MKVAKATSDEFDKVYNFINIMDSLFDNKYWLDSEEDWRNWDDEDEDKKLLLEIEKELKSYGDEDNRLILYEFIKKKWRETNYSGSFQRIVTDADVLIDNVCDPNVSYLEFKPELKEAIEKYNAENKGDEE